jgi:pimeloyl-ACP methyl ester carboxylesterase
LLIDLLTAGEESEDAYSGHHRFNIELLADRLIGATDWLCDHPTTSSLAIGYFGASTGGGAALVAAAKRQKQIAAVVSRGGRPDLAGPMLPFVQAPTLLIVGGDDVPVIEMNEFALGRLTAREKKLAIVPGASHLFEEPGTLDEVARLAGDWFLKYLTPLIVDRLWRKDDGSIVETASRTRGIAAVD